MEALVAAFLAAATPRRMSLVRAFAFAPWREQLCCADGTTRRAYTGSDPAVRVAARRSVAATCFRDAGVLFRPCFDAEVYAAVYGAVP